MKILINLSIIQTGGGIQVAHSFLKEIVSFHEHDYHILLSQKLGVLIAKDSFPFNFNFYSISPSPSIFIKRYNSLKKMKLLEKKIRPDIVFTLFGPSYWRPQAPHLCGYALPHFIYTESPFYKIITYRECIKWRLLGAIKFFSLIKDCDYYVTETEDASHRLTAKLRVSRDKVFTVNNAYNSVFNSPELWKSVQNKIVLAKGFRLITISSLYVHKNLAIIPAVIDYLNLTYPDFEFIFILTIKAKELPNLTVRQKKHILFLGSVNIEECPALYQQSDALFMPTLLECFTVSYLEAMKMEKPILTSNLSFAHDICKDAAMYFEPLQAESIAESIIKLAASKELQLDLINKGKGRLKDFGTAEDRAKSYIQIMEKIVANNSTTQLHMKNKR